LCAPALSDSRDLGRRISPHTFDRIRNSGCRGTAGKMQRTDTRMRRTQNNPQDGSEVRARQYSGAHRVIGVAFCRELDAAHRERHHQFRPFPKILRKHKLVNRIGKRERRDVMSQATQTGIVCCVASTRLPTKWGTQALGFERMVCNGVPTIPIGSTVSIIGFGSSSADVGPRQEKAGSRLIRSDLRTPEVATQPKPGTITSVGVDKRSILVSGVG
jgi:hypothetical protein